MHDGDDKRRYGDGDGGDNDLIAASKVPRVTPCHALLLVFC